MALFNVTVRELRTSEYDIVVEAENERLAEEEADRMLDDLDFQFRVSDYSEQIETEFTVSNVLMIEE